MCINHLVAVNRVRVPEKLTNYFLVFGAYDRQFNGRSFRAILEEDRIHLIPGDLVHRSLCRWLWSKIVRIGLDEFVDYFNNNKIHKQPNRILPSGVAPNVVFDIPGNFGLENLAIPVTQEALDELRGLINTPRKEAFRWVSDELMGLQWKPILR
ncbi:hypothetical protein C8J57DRAFT_1228076 [Mycena rebaudengoi]|nr:hypothetical protein C8J57DRAFT_1228076 [Mycena rebaudengoi]